MTRAHALAVALLVALAVVDAHAATPTSRPASADGVAGPAVVRLVITLEVSPDGSSRLVRSEPLSPDLLGRLAEQLAADRAESAARAARAEAETRSRTAAPAGPPKPASPHQPGASPDRRPAARPGATADPEPAAEARPPYPGQCSAVAVSTGQRCRQRSEKGSDRCRFHQRPRPEPADRRPVAAQASR